SPRARPHRNPWLLDFRLAAPCRCRHPAPTHAPAGDFGVKRFFPVWFPALFAFAQCRPTSRGVQSEFLGPIIEKPMIEFRILACPEKTQQTTYRHPGKELVMG